MTSTNYCVVIHPNSHHKFFLLFINFHIFQRWTLAAADYQHFMLLTTVVHHLLFEVAPLLLVDQHQVQVVSHRELLVDVSHGGSQVITSQE